jgi:Beta-1,4-N-acetylgalactosaminyltransferase (CgtA)
MWTIEPEQIWKKQRFAGISGFMRLKNEAEFLDRAIATHIDGLDELIIVFNDCSDQTPEICYRWAHRLPEKIRVFEYEPKIIPIGTPESLAVNPRSPHCIANYYNFALSLTNRKVAIKIDGDHHAVARRFSRICARVRHTLPPKRRYPIYGLNITEDRGELVIYNYYNYRPHFSGNGSAKKGPPPFTSGDHAFYHVDATCWHTVDSVEGYEVMDLTDKPRFEGAPFTYAFFHLKGLKQDRGTGNWTTTQAGTSHLRSDWTRNVLSPDSVHLASIEAMRRHNPAYFRGANVLQELRATFPDIPIRMPANETLPPFTLRERLADVWYRIAYP